MRSSRRWAGQDRAALALRFTLVVLPTVVALAVALLGVRVVPESQTMLGRFGWLIAVAAASFLAARATSLVKDRFLPLAALLRLSLVFPDQAPSRMKMAIRASSPKRLQAEVEAARHHGLSSDATEAASQVLLLTAALGEHDRRTRGHSERVRLFTRLLGEEMGVRDEDLERLQWGALLHDVGKLTIPVDILNKPGKLDETEWAIMSGHAEAGSELVAPLRPFLGEYIQAADGHHEKWDGSGYPHGLRGQEIPLAARIVAVADAYEVMTAARAYKKPMSAEAARAELTRCAGTHFDPDVVRAWLRISIGDVNRAAGPSAFIAGLPFVGELVSFAGRTASQVAAAPAAVASAAPAAATAGAMTVAMAAGPAWNVPRNPADALLLDVPAAAVTETTIDPLTPSTVPLTVPSTTSIPAAPTTAAPAPTTSAPSTTALPTSTTALPTSTTSVPSTTSAPSTTALPASTTLPTTSTTTPTTTTAPTGASSIVGVSGAPVTLHGAISSGDDLTHNGPYRTGTHLFQQPARVLGTEVEVDGVVLPAGTAVCMNLIVSNDAEDEPRWQFTFDRDVLAVAWTTQGLAATDSLYGGGISWDTSGDRGLDPGDRIQVIGNNSKVKLDLEGTSSDSIRIFVDCG